MSKLKSVSDKSYRAGSQRGFSLLELMLVMAIMVLFASLIAPSVFQLIRNQNLGKSGDLVRAKMGSARVRAIRTGQIHALYLVNNESWFSVAPFSQVSEMAQRANQAISRRQAQPDGFDADLLPEGIRFGQETTDLDPRAMQVLSVGQTGGAVRPVLFYPDGTSQSAQIQLIDERGNRLVVELRGLTGTAKLRRLGPGE